MLKTLKKAGLAAILLAMLATAIVYGLLYLSLPTLSGKASVPHVVEPATLSRDDKGIAVITSENRQDAAYALGYAHSQDRFFQMDLLRRNAAGELSELFGDAALDLDKRRRFHRLRTHSQKILSRLSDSNKALLESYSHGVNDALQHSSYPSFTYLLTGAERREWQPEDSLLVIFSMYFDLQESNYQRDLLYTQIKKDFGEDMLQFITQTSSFQAALDNSRLPVSNIKPPELSPTLLASAIWQPIDEAPEIGSNNWAVSGDLTESGNAMLANDMHLGINVPVIWYRAQLNIKEGKGFSVDGVTLPGTPAVIVGSNRHVAWGFTNSYVDSADWIHLPDDTPTEQITEVIKSDGQDINYVIELSEFGPVTTMDGEKYALSWVAHQDYAVNLNLVNFEQVTSVSEALQTSKSVGMPVQNMTLVDKEGNIAWQLTGAVPSRSTPTNTAISPEEYSTDWQQQAQDIPFVFNPSSNRIWTANSRVVSADSYNRFGDGGYALGARSQQIRDRLFEKERFSEQDFYRIQLDNEARFLERWHKFLLALLQTNAQRYKKDIDALENWQQCACSDSVGYTLVRRFRDAMMEHTFAPLETALEKHDLSLRATRRTLEPALWQLVTQQPDSWKPKVSSSWQAFMLSTYGKMKHDLLVQITGHGDTSINALNWGSVNQFKPRHPFSRQIPLLSGLLDMPAFQGTGDKFMPAVQGHEFGASQRLFVQPGNEKTAVLTVPGGQSEHPMSPYYRSGYQDFVEDKETPLLPGTIANTISFFPMKP